MFIRLANLSARHQRVFVLLIALVVGVVVAALHATIDQEDHLDDFRAAILRRPASNQIILVKMDDYSLDKMGPLPWPRSSHANLVDELRNAGAKRIIFDVDFSSESLDPLQDISFARSLKRSPRLVVLPGPIQPYTDASSKIISSLPIPMLSKNSLLAYTYENDSDHRITYTRNVGGHIAPALPNYLSGRDDLPNEGAFRIDWSIDPASFKSVSYYDVLKHKIPSSFFQNRIVLIAATSGRLGISAISPVYGAIPGAEMQMVAGETLRRGVPRPIGQLPMLTLAMAIVASACLSRRGIVRVSLLVGGAGLVFAIPLWFRWSTPITIESVAAFATIGAAIVAQCWIWAAKLFAAQDGKPDDATSYSRRPFRPRGLAPRLSTS